MFTGLVRCLGAVKDASPFGKGRRFRIDIGPLAEHATVGQSIAVNGACLTITTLSGPEATFDAVSETVFRTNLGAIRAGDKVNLEPALKAGDVLDGHIVLGHVDALAPILSIDAANADNRVVKITLPQNIRHLVAEKGSIAVNGISLTVAQATADWFTVSIIPHSWDNSSLSLLNAGDGVNLEADVMARYVARLMQYPHDWQLSSTQGPGTTGGISESFLQENGFA